jgi:hypothetical protein
MSTVLDFNSKSLSDRPISVLINELIEKAEPPGENIRQYLGASALGTECSRRVQYDWLCAPKFPARLHDIFDRGHWSEALSRRHMKAAGFDFALDDRLAFSVCGDLFRGHADGILTAGPAIPGLKYPCIWEHKCLKAKGYHAIERDGLTGLYAPYKAQTALYQFYLQCPSAALFTVLNADDCQRLHFLVPFDAALAQRMIDKAVAIIEATKAGELLPRISNSPDDWRCRMCGHHERCWLS